MKGKRRVSKTASSQSLERAIRAAIKQLSVAV
jgi:hypothetical protein